MNKVIIMGRLTRDPEVRYSAGDNSMAIARQDTPWQWTAGSAGTVSPTQILSGALLSAEAQSLLRNISVRVQRS